jgi:hypothetical protein
MTIEGENAFKRAFVIYVVSMILSLGTKYDHTSLDYREALVDPYTIHTFDWCEYVIYRLFDAVVKVKSDIRGNCKAYSITGCSLFLQVQLCSHVTKSKYITCAFTDRMYLRDGILMELCYVYRFFIWTT